MDFPIDKLGNTTVGLGHQYWLGLTFDSTGLKVEDGGDDLGCTNAAVGAAGMHAEALMQRHHVGSADPHHGATVGVEAHREYDRQIGLACSGDGVFDLFL